MIADARAARARACARLGEKLAVVREHLDAAAEADEARHEDEVRKLLALKKSTAAAFERVGAFVAAERDTREETKKARRKEAAELLARGENPHEVFLRRDKARRRARREAEAARENEAPRRKSRRASRASARGSSAAAATPTTRRGGTTRGTGKRSG